jgi:hypothetical protein
MSAHDLPVGFYPFWFWNAHLDADEVRRQIREMAAQGVRGFFIHPRQGLVQPYLSDAFFAMVDVALEEAEAQGLVVHLYDEYPYPSGVAGGEVIAGEPGLYATRLVHVSRTVHGGSIRMALPRGKVLACFAYPVTAGVVAWDRPLDLREQVGMVLTHDSYVETGLTPYNRKRYFASDPLPVLETELAAGTYRLAAAVQVVVDHHKYWGHFVDVLNSEAVRRFLDLTHARYAQRYGDRFGRIIASIFVDETQPGWSAKLPAVFESRYGYDLAPLLPALHHPEHPEHRRVSRDLDRLRYDLFCETFEAPVAAWCHEHGLAYAGEKPSMRMAQLRYMDIPGCEPGHTKVGVQPDWLRPHLRGNARATASAAFFYGKVGALCECYHSMGWSATLQDAKTVADGLLLAGIAYLVPHGFFYSTHGLAKHDAPPTFFVQMPFWPMFGHLSSYVDRIGRAFTGTYLDAEVLVVDPSWGQPDAEDLAAYEALLWALMRAHLDFHIVATDMLIGSDVDNGTVRVSDITAHVVVMPPREEIDLELRTWLDTFAASGGVVVEVEDRECVTDAVARIGTHAAPSLSIWMGEDEASDVAVVKRVGDGVVRWFGFNLGGGALEVSFEAGVALHELPLSDTYPPMLRREGTVYRRTLAPYEAFLLETAPHGPKDGSGSSPAQRSLPCITVDVGGRATVIPRNPNVLRLGRWRMALRSGDGAYSDSVEVEAIPLANQLAQSGLPFTPVFRTYFGHAPEMALPELTVRYSATFNVSYDGSVELVMEPGSLAGTWSITINDALTLTPADFAPTEAHVRGSLGVDITAVLMPGENVIRVEVTTDRDDGGLRNPLYLAGDFGVELAPLSVVPPVRQGRFEAYEANGLPFYAGVVDYSTSFVLEKVPPVDRVLVIFAYAGPFHEAAEVSVNDGPWLPALWSPRQVVVPTSALRTGENLLRTRVYTTLIRPFEGQWFDYDAHCQRDVIS